MQEKMIPVIGVPPVLQTFPNKNATPPKKIKKVAIKNPPNPDKVTARKAKKLFSKVEKSTLISPECPELITETGLPPSQNGAFVLEEERKLNRAEQREYSFWLDAQPLPNQNATTKQQKRHRFKLRMIWLLNKEIMLNPKNNKSIHRKVAREMKKPQTNKEKKTTERVEKMEIPKEKKSKKIEKEEEEETIRFDLTHLTPEKMNMTKLMDVVVQRPHFAENNTEEFQDFYENSGGNYGDGSAGGAGYSNGYQYLSEDWCNDDKPWRKFQTGAPPPTSSSSSDFYGSYNNYHEYPTSSDPAMMSQWNPMMDPYSTYQYPVPYVDAYPQQQQMSSIGYNPSGIDFTAPPPSSSGGAPRPSAIESLAQLIRARQTTSEAPTEDLAPGVDPGFVSQYRQAFPVENAAQSQSQISQNYSISQQQSVQPIVHRSSPYAPPALLEASEEELARQKRLLEIEEELRMINARKMQMQMEEEIRQREFELALQTQRMQEREMRHVREHRRADDYSNSSSSRRRYDDSRGGHVDDYYANRHSASSYSDRPYSYSTSNPHGRGHQQISINEEEETEEYSSGRRYGGQLLLLQKGGGGNQKKQKNTRDERGGGEGCSNSSLKRPADGRHGIPQGVASIRPAAKRPRHRKLKKSGVSNDDEELQMQAISDDDEQ